MFTYIYFYRTVRKIRRLESIAATQPQESGLNLLISKFTPPCYVVFTYTSFNLSSTVMMTASLLVENEKQSEFLFTFSLVPTLTGFASDAAIYVYVNREVRKLLCSVCRSRGLQHANRVMSPCKLHLNRIKSKKFFYKLWYTVKSRIYTLGLQTFLSTFWGAYIRRGAWIQRAFCIIICVSKLYNLPYYWKDTDRQER